jgi:hypothetical protein
MNMETGETQIGLDWRVQSLTPVWFLGYYWNSLLCKSAFWTYYRKRRAVYY